MGDSAPPMPAQPGPFAYAAEPGVVRIRAIIAIAAGALIFLSPAEAREHGRLLLDLADEAEARGGPK